MTVVEWLQGAGTLIVGGVLTQFGAWLQGRRDRGKEKRDDDRRKAARGREHAEKALAIVRKAHDQSWSRPVDEGSFDVDLTDLDLEIAEAEVDLIPEPVLRPRLSLVLNAVRFPHTVAGSAHSPGIPVEVQRSGLLQAREALAAYLREEPTPPAKGNELAALAKANKDAHQDDSNWHAKREKEERAAKAKAAKKR